MESFLIKNIDNMNVYKASIAIDEFNSSIMHIKVPVLRKFVNKEYFLTPVMNVICMSLTSAFFVYDIILLA